MEYHGRDHDPDAAVCVYLDGAARELEHSNVAVYEWADELSAEINRIRSATVVEVRECLVGRAGS